MSAGKSDHLIFVPKFAYKAMSIFALSVVGKTVLFPKTGCVLKSDNVLGICACTGEMFAIALQTGTEHDLVTTERRDDMLYA